MPETTTYLIERNLPSLQGCQCRLDTCCHRALASFLVRGRVVVGGGRWPPILAVVGLRCTEHRRYRPRLKPSSTAFAVELHGQVQGPILEVPRLVTARKRKTGKVRRGRRPRRRSSTRRLPELSTLAMVAVIVVVVVVVDVAELFAVDVVVVVATVVDVDARSRNLRFESVQGTRLPGMALKRRR